MDFAPEITQAFQVDLTQASSTTIVEVVNFATVLSTFTPPSGYLLTNYCACAIESIQANYILPSIKGIAPVDVGIGDSQAERAAKYAENVRIAPCKRIGLYVDLGNGTWKIRSVLELQNHGDTNVGIYSYHPLLVPLLDDGKGYYGKSQRIGAAVLAQQGSTILGTNDLISIVGSVRLIPRLVEVDTTTVFTGNNNFAVNVTNASAVQVLAARSDRKELRLTTTQDIWFRFGSSGTGVSANSCARLKAGQALTYENGRLAFEGDRGELIAQRYTQGFALWARADSATAVVSGEEFW